jgi:hemerythrin-like domain-containing protein
VNPMLHRNPIVMDTGLDSAPMNLFDAPAGFDDPIGMWLGCHRRIEKQLKTLAKLSAHLSDKGIDAEASTAAQAILRYFEKSGPHHHEDEDRDLFPLIEKRITVAGDLAAFRDLRARLEDDHRRMEPCWARLRKPLQGIADGIAKPLAEGDVHAFRTIYEGHIPAEDGAIPDLARRYLSAGDLEALGRSMAARRGVTYPA